MGLGLLMRMLLCWVFSEPLPGFSFVSALLDPGQARDDSALWLLLKTDCWALLQLLFLSWNRVLTLNHAPSPASSSLPGLPPGERQLCEEFLWRGEGGRGGAG